MSKLQFQIEAQAHHSRARAGRLRTLHSEVLTPVFMPVGTQATVRAQTFDTLEDLGAQVILANTYHLMLRPGIEVFQRLGGIHQFNGWKKSVLTDSGGFQIFSLPRMGGSFSIDDEQGAVFRSHVDGKRVELTPERSIEMQRAIGSDIMMVLDQCVPSTCDHPTALEALERTHRWAKRSLDARGDSPQSLFGIVQGACFEDLRRQSAAQITELPFDGFAIGGLAVGESKAQREDFTELTASLLPSDLPRYLMGVGTPIDLLEAVHRGVDMFDCVLPTLLAQQGVVFTSRGRLDLRRGIYKFSEMRLDPECGCSTCTRYSRAYLSHLIKAKEVLGWQLLGTHNLHFYLMLMSQMRQAILENRFIEFYREKREPLSRQTDEDHPPTPPIRKRKPSDKRPLRRGDYEIQIHPSGAGRILHRVSGEVMHPVADPREEARLLYVEGSGLSQAFERGESLTLWDVGMGAATNAMAAIAALERSPQSMLKILSFERDLDPLRLATDHPHSFPHVKHRAPHLLLESGEYVSPDGRLRWRLIEGDFEKTAFEQSELPDFVFFDPFSAKTDAPLWHWRFLERLKVHWSGADSSRAVRIANYSNSTAQRASVLAAGFWIASGPPSARRPDTSIWLTRAPQSGQLLGREWLERWQRSSAPAPESVMQGLVSEREEFLERVRKHPQFAL
jgi:queuine tRNA-ribosyltransferase